VLVRCTYEELMALAAGAEMTLEGVVRGGVGIAAPPRELADVEKLLAHADGDFELQNLSDQRSLARAVDAILETLHARMEDTVLEGYVGAEDAVVAYFDYAHVLTVRERVRRTGEEMEAVNELMNGAPVIAECSGHGGFSDEV